MLTAISSLIQSLRALTLVSMLLRLLLSLALGGLIGMERERRDRPAGLRTYIIVCLGATLAALLGQFAAEVMGFDSDPLRVGAQVISGIGFLGAGTILVRSRFQITGLTTAASLWTTAVIGLAVGIGFYEGALLCTLVAFFTIKLLHRAERRFLRTHQQLALYIELRDTESVKPFLAEIASAYHTTTLQIVTPKSGIAGHVGVEGVFSLTDGTAEALIETMNKRSDVAFALRSL